MKHAITLLLISLSFGAHANFAECILEKMPGSVNDAVTNAAHSTCAADYPARFFDIEQGSGLGIFDHSDANACVLKSAKNTPSNRASYQIAAACRCLYTPALFKGEMCDYRPKPPAVYVPPPPVLVAPPPVVQAPPAAPPPVFTPQKPTKEELREKKRQAEYEKQVKLDLQRASEAAIKDYPYLDTPDGQRAIDKIMAKRDLLIYQGVYPSDALRQAVNDHAPFNAPRAPKEAPKTELNSPEPVKHSGFPSECRWVTPQDWSCKP